MNNGIIQKAFNNYYKQTYLSVVYKYELEQIKQELIEKIKEERHTMYREPSGWFEYIHLEKLIGDSSE